MSLGIINIEFLETIENVNRGDTLYKFVERLKEKDGDEDEVLEVYYLAMNTIS